MDCATDDGCRVDRPQGSNIKPNKIKCVVLKKRKTKPLEMIMAFLNIVSCLQYILGFSDFIYNYRWFDGHIHEKQNQKHVDMFFVEKNKLARMNNYKLPEKWLKIVHQQSQYGNCLFHAEIGFIPVSLLPFFLVCYNFWKK